MENFLKRQEYQIILPVSWETCMRVKKQQLEPCKKQLIGSWLRKEYDRLFLSPCLFNLYPEHIMWNARLDELQTGVKVASRNTNNLIYANDTTLMAESEDEFKSLLMRVKEQSEKWA